MLWDNVRSLSDIEVCGICCFFPIHKVSSIGEGNSIESASFVCEEFLLTSIHLLISFYALRNHSDYSGVFLFLDVKSSGILVILFDLQKMTASGSSF